MDINQRSFNPDRTQFIPKELRDLNQWVLWKLTKTGEGKITKIPYSCKSGKKASSTDPETWCSFQDCVAEYEDNEKWSGIGFVFTPGDPFCGIDIDHAISENRAPTIECLRLMQDIGPTYTEVSPSGAGLHIIGRGVIPSGKKTDAFEIYDRGRYFTITGDLFDPMAENSVRDISNGIRTITAPVVMPGAVSVDPNDWKNINIVFAPDRGPSIDKYMALLESDKKMKALIERTRTDMRDSSPSAYDMAIASILIMSGWSDQDITDMLLYVRRKHGDDLKRADYYQRTIHRCKTGRDVAKAVGDLGTIDHDDRDGALENIRRISRLPIAKIIQEGERDSHWILRMDDGTTWDIGDTCKVCERSTWIRIAIEYGAEIPNITNKQWPAFVRAITICKVIEKNEDITIHGQVKALLNQYVISKIDNLPMDGKDDDLVDEVFLRSKPYRSNIEVFISAKAFQDWATTTNGYRKTPGQTASALTAIGLQRTAIVRQINKKGVCRSYYKYAISG